MTFKFIRKEIRYIKRQLRRKKFAFMAVALILVGSVLAYTTYMQNNRLSVNPATYAQLLNLIAHAESKDNYNAYFSNAGNNTINFTNMSIQDVLRWQSDFVAQGNASSAVGRYQIINTTLEGLVRRLDVDTNQKFDQAMQDRFAIALLERRGANDYVNSELTREEFAANLAKEWAGLPKVIGENPGDSYYASDGLNKSLVAVDDVMEAIEPIRPL